MIKIAWHPSYVHPVPDGHRFPMEKYELLPMRLIREGIVTDDNFFEPTQGLTYNLDVHDSEYLKRLFNLELTKKEVRASGFTLSQDLVERELLITNGTVEGALWALNNRSAAFNIAGGTHHASANKAEGFCLLNDQAIASRYLLDNTKVSQILIIDLDVHQGNGTAQIFKNINNVYTFSMHGANNYPYHKPPSDLDIPLPDNRAAEEQNKDPLIGEEADVVRNHAFSYIKERIIQENSININTNSEGILMINNYLDEIPWKKIDEHRGEILGLLGGRSYIRKKKVNRKTRIRKNKKKINKKSLKGINKNLNKITKKNKKNKNIKRNKQTKKG